MSPGFAIKMMRAYLRGLAWLSPNAAIRTAARFYTTPPRGKPMSTTDRVLFSSARTGTVSFRDVVLPTWEWGDDNGPKVLLVHGWGVDPWLFSPLIRALLENGFAVVTYASPGHEGDRRYQTTAMTWVHAFRAVTNSAGPFYALIGHSLGAATIICTARSGLPAKRIVLLSTCSDLVENTDAFVKRLGLDGETAKAMRAKIWSDYEQDCVPLAADWESLYNTESNVPTLLVHDRNDSVLPPTHSTRVAERWSNATVHLTDGLGHFSVARNPEVIQQVITFLR